jgi:signal transduction histidine kinase
MEDAATHPRLVMNLTTGEPGDTVRDVLRRALGDPDLDIVYPRVGTGGWIDEFGDATTTAVASRAFTPIDRGGKPVAALIHDPALLDDPERMQAATRAASLAIDNERLKAQLHAQLAEVHASRARIVDAGDRELRRVERNLHDGAQQRLVGLVLMLRLASREAEGNRVLTELIADATKELDDALSELRELARGIHPAIVDDAGLGGAFETLAERPGLPVDLHVDIPERLPHPVEIGAYYLVAEALTNANKYANAGQARVRATVVNGALRVTVSDDGTGGAGATPGSGLEGLADRVMALGGQLLVESPPGGGTTVSADIPLTAPPDVDVERRRLTALKWMGWENWEAPGELYEQITEEDNLTDIKAVLLCAGGNSQLTRREREWFIGYHTAAGSSDRVIDLIKSYDDSDTIEGLMQLPGMKNTCRGFLYEALRVCSSDGPLAPEELNRLRRGADAMGIPRETLAELHQIVIAEQALRDRRYALVTAPVLPGNVNVRSSGNDSSRRPPSYFDLKKSP